MVPTFKGPDPCPNCHAFSQGFKIHGYRMLQDATPQRRAAFHFQTLEDRKCCCQESHVIVHLLQGLAGSSIIGHSTVSLVWKKTTIPQVSQEGFTCTTCLLWNL